MLIKCLLGRILPVDGLPNCTLVGVRNSTKWIFEITHERRPASENLAEDPPEVVFQLKLIDWRTGKPIPKGWLQPTLVPRTPEAAAAKVYFPTCEDGLVAVSLENIPKGVVKFRLAVDAAHSLMR